MRLLSTLRDAKNTEIRTIGELLDAKWVGWLFPKIQGVAKWGFVELRTFFTIHAIKNTDTFEEALEKLAKKPFKS